MHKWNKIKLKGAIPQTPTESAPDQNDEPRNIKEDMRMVNKVTQAANVREKCKVRIDSCNIANNRKFRKRKTYSEVVKEKETERQDEKVFDLETIKENLLQDEVLQPCVLSSPLVCCDTSVSKNSSDRFVNTNSPSVLTAQDEELVKILEDLDCSKITRENANSSDESRLSGYFCSDTVFNLSKRVLSETFSEIPSFRSRSAWKPPKGNPNLEMFLSKVEQDLFKTIETPTRYSNLSSDEWKAIRSLADDRNIVIKRADKGSAVVVWGKVDYIKKAQKQLKDENVYRKVNFKDQNLSELVDKSNHFFRGLKTKGCITDKNLKYFTYQYKKACNLGKLYLLPKIHKRLYEVPGRPVISNCGAPTEKVSEFLDFHLKSIMQEGASYIKDTTDFQEKVKSLRVPKDAFLVTADVVGLYPNIPHEAGLKSLKEALDRRREKKISTEDLVKMPEFLLKSNYFEFDRSVYQQVSGTAVDTKFAPPYACIFMDRLENSFLGKQSLKPLVWLRYIDDIFFIWTHSEKELKESMREFNSFDTNIKFTYEYSDKKVSILDLQVDIVEGKLITSLFVKPTD